MLFADMGFFELFNGFSTDQQFVLTIIALACGVAVVIAVTGILSGVYASVKQAERETELKRDLIAQGKSAEEIEQIVHPADGFCRAIGKWGRK